MSIIRVEHGKNYTCIKNETLRDNRLSFKARGVHHLLLSYPDNWTVSIEHLVGQSDKDGKAAIMTALKELQECGYMTMSRVRDEKTGFFIGWEKVIRETPIPYLEAITTEVRKSDLGTEVRKPAKRKTRKTENPQDGEPGHIINTDSNKYLGEEVFTLPPTSLKEGNEREREENFEPEEIGTHPQSLATHPNKLEAPHNEPTNLDLDMLSLAAAVGFDELCSVGERTTASAEKAALPAGSANRHMAGQELASVGVQQEANTRSQAATITKPSSPPTPKLDPKLGMGTPSARSRQVQRSQAIATPVYKFSGPWQTDEQFQEFQQQLYEHAKLKGKFDPSAWVAKVVDGISKGIRSSLWDDFQAKRPLGSADAEGINYLAPDGKPYEHFREDRIQYYIAKGEPLPSATQKADADLAFPKIGNSLWEGFLRRTDREADEALAASKLGVANPVLSPCFTPREKATLESVAAKLDAIASSTTLPPAQNSASCPVPEVKSDQLTEDQKFQALLQGMRGHIKSGQTGRVRLATQWADMNSLHVRKIYNSTREVVDFEEVEF